jgi:hypothetical protein
MNRIPYAIADIFSSKITSIGTFYYTFSALCLIGFFSSSIFGGRAECCKLYCTEYSCVLLKAEAVVLGLKLSDVGDGAGEDLRFGMRPACDSHQ